MRIDILKQPLILTLFLYGALATLFCISSTYLPSSEELYTASTPVADFIHKLNIRFPVLSEIIAVLFIFSNGLALSRILSRHMVFSSRTYLPIITYLVAGCGIWYGGRDLAALFGSFLLIRASEYFISSFVRNNTFNLTFRGALLIGIIPILYPSGIIYILMIPVAMAVFRRRTRETITALIGGVLPLLLYAYIMWILDRGFFGSLLSLWESLKINYDFAIGFNDAGDIMRIVALGLIALLTLAGLTSFTLFSDKMRTRARAIFIYSILMLLVCLIGFLIPATGTATLLYLGIPVSMIIPAFFSNFPGVVSGVSYMLMLLSVITLNVYTMLV